mmetsp:Transcript_8442/g.9541  ORF Transcript_8442/g.9541 Transcript_8442/m.9541 type:complete len:250 (-) Transcript_8442:176-925(-)|eukprot:CAMPEP_0176447924 /NCGR_PEP_ID=MMETSP0127-20121128/25398_1 /TAXON_ID=938130 /ORGANISM="Platyophrya macrostoma, Strain WH" /LENGTH=249 /DNA_ID=CAMNT_0017834617 /DNA_START=24 /DNA_END=773 /DNA_ORIENTATION=+
MNSPIKTVELVIKFLATTPGRDKTCRIFQYFLKFLKAYLLNLSTKRNDPALKELSNKVGLVSVNMSTTRKVLRFGRPIGLTYNLFKLLAAFTKKPEEGDNLLKEKDAGYVTFKTAELISSFVYFLTDHLLWAVRVGAMAKPSYYSKVDYTCDMTWLLECIFGITHNLINISITKNALKVKAEKDPSNKDKLTKECATQVLACNVDIARNIVDIPVCIGFLKPGSVSEEAMGLLGTVSSIIGIYQNWPSS